MSLTTDARRIRAAIFDFDGTLSDSMYIWTDMPRQVIIQHGVNAPEDLIREIAPLTMDESLEYIRTHYLPDFSTAALKDELYALISAHYADNVPPKPGALELVRRLHAQGMPLCVLSATDPHMIKSALNRFGILDCFKFVSYSDDFGGKTHPECFLDAASRLGYAPAEIAVFEDALHAAETAKREGFYIAGRYDASYAQDWDKLKAISDWSEPDMSKWGE